MKHAILLSALIATQAHAQIIYTDVDPDALYTGSNDTCHLDLNNDGNIDFLIVQRTVNAPCPGGGLGAPACAATNTQPQRSVRITPLGTNAVARTTFSASQLPQGDVIDPALTWSNSSGRALIAQGAPLCADFFGAYMCWEGPSDGAWFYNDSDTDPYFLGLRFNSGGNNYYGWARLSVPFDANSFTLRSYAYNSVFGEAIVAGDEGATGITSLALRGMQVSPNPFSSTLSVSLPTGTTGSVSCRLLSLIGQAVITRTFAATSGPSAITLELGSLAPGTYLLEMENGGERIVRKVIKL